MGNKHSTSYSTGSTTLETSSYKSNKSNFKRTGSLPSRLNHAKNNSLYDFENTAKFLYIRAESFKGLKNDTDYKQIQTEVVEASKELQEYRNRLRKSDRLAADDIQRTLSSCLSILVKKAQDNESTVLDSAAVESDSFIAQNVDAKSENTEPEPAPAQATVPQPQEPEVKLRKEVKKVAKESPKHNRKSAHSTTSGSRYHRRMQPLHEIEREVKYLKADIDEAILLQHTDQFEPLEKRIKSICIQLELIKDENFTPLSEKKNELYDVMIKCNKSIKKSRRKIQRQSAVDTHVTNTNSTSRELDAIENKIKEAEKQLEKEEAVSSVKDKMKDLLVKLNNIKESSSTKDRKNAAIRKIKNILNDVQVLDVEQRLNKLQMMVLNFNDFKESSQYIILDQLLRQLWDEVSELELPTYKKQIIVNQIQEALKLLVKNCKETPETEQSNDGTLYENKSAIKQHTLASHSAGAPQKINKPPLPSPRDVSTSDSNIDGYQNNLIQQLQLLDDVSNWNSVSEREAAIIKHRLTNIMNKIDQALDGLPKNSQMGKTVAESDVDIGAKQSKEEGFVAKHETGLSKKYGSLDDLEVAKNGSIKLAKSYDAIQNQTEPEHNAIQFNFSNKNAIILPKPPQNNDLSQLTDQISSIQKTVQELHTQVQDFSGIFKDTNYERIQNALNHCIENLNSIDASGYATAETTKSQLLQQTLNALDELANKLLQNQVTYKATKAELKEVAEKLANLKKKIDNFSGAYKNVLYVQIESELLKCLDRLQSFSVISDTKLQHAIAQTKQKNEQFLKILEQKSTKSYSAEVTAETVQLNGEESPKLPSEEIKKVRQRLLKVKNDAERFSGSTEDPIFALIQNDLYECREQLEQIQDLGHQSVIDSRKQYLDYIEQLHNYLEQKAEQAIYYQDIKNETR